MTTEKQTKGSNIRREDTFGRPLKHQTYEMLLTTHEKIKIHSKDYKLTAGELFEVMFEAADWAKVEPLARALRARKEEARAKASEARKASEPPAATALAKKLKELTPEQLAQVQAIIGKV